MEDHPLIVFVDIDDTLIRNFGSKRVPLTPVVNSIRRLHADGAVLYAWSTKGADYARSSATELGLSDCFTGYLPKPNVLIDNQEPGEWSRTIHVRPQESANLSADDYLRRLAWTHEASQPEVTVLYRPVGPIELALIAGSANRRFPSRLPEQPIFYPVCNEDYARQIAEQWNVPASGAGFVTRFAVKTSFLAGYERHVVGGAIHEEYWIPSEDLEAFNDAIVGEIETIVSFPSSNRGG